MKLLIGQPWWPWLRVLLGISVLSVQAACSREENGRFRVQGQVSVNGKPLEHGSVLFIPLPPTKGPEAGAVILDGAYDLQAGEGPVAGSHRVEIRADMTHSYEYDITNPREYLAHGPHAPVRQPIPPEYNVRSKQEVQVSPTGENVFDFHLQTEEILKTSNKQSR